TRLLGSRCCAGLDHPQRERLCNSRIRFSGACQGECRGALPDADAARASNTGSSASAARPFVSIAAFAEIVRRAASEVRKLMQMRLLLTTRNFVVVVLALLMFVLGLTMHKYLYLYFPYPQLSSLAKTAARSVRSVYVNPKEVLSRQYSYDADKSTLEKDIDTALLPLKVKGIRLSDDYPIPKIAGGITTLGDGVIVLDRLGNIYSYRPDAGHVEKLPFPALPNNINDYLLTSGAHVDTDTFRAYNIKYLAFAKLLAVSHEYFDKQYNGTRLAVSVIGFDVDSMQGGASSRVSNTRFSSGVLGLAGNCAANG